MRKPPVDSQKVNQSVDSDTHQQNNTQTDWSPQSIHPESELPTAESIKQWIVNWLAKELKFKAQSIDPRKSFADYGLDSVVAVQLAQNLGDWLGKNLDATIAWNFPTIESLAIHLASKSQPDLSSSPAPKTSELKNLSEDDIESSIAEGLAKLETLLKDN